MNVAALAGIPTDIIKDAQVVCDQFEQCVAKTSMVKAFDTNVLFKFLLR